MIRYSEPRVSCVGYFERLLPCAGFREPQASGTTQVTALQNLSASAALGARGSLLSVGMLECAGQDMSRLLCDVGVNPSMARRAAELHPMDVNAALDFVQSPQLALPLAFPIFQVVC